MLPGQVGSKQGVRRGCQSKALGRETRARRGLAGTCRGWWLAWGCKEAEGGGELGRPRRAEDSVVQTPRGAVGGQWAGPRAGLDQSGGGVSTRVGGTEGGGGMGPGVGPSGVWREGGREGDLVTSCQWATAFLAEGPGGLRVELRRASCCCCRIPHPPALGSPRRDGELYDPIRRPGLPFPTRGGPGVVLASSHGVTRGKRTSPPTMPPTREEKPHPSLPARCGGPQVLLPWGSLFSRSACAPLCRWTQHSGGGASGRAPGFSRIPP